jgi:hypothetical protein
MIIQSDPEGDEQIQAMEERLARTYRLAPKDLYAVLRHADFHRTWKDRPQDWNAAAYAAFSGEVLTHTLDHERLKGLLADFDGERASHRTAWEASSIEDLQKGERRRQYRNHVAIAHRYACAVASDYVFPVPDILDRLTPDQFRQFNDYLAYISEHALIPAGKLARLACQRQLDDLARSHTEEKCRT